MICLIHLEFADVIQSSIETTINSGGETVINWTPSGSGRYFVYLIYNTDLLPVETRTNLFNSHFPHANWDAALTISTPQSVLVCTNRLQLEPAINSGNRQYFRVGEYELKKPERIEVHLNPKEAFPFGSAPTLSIRPTGVYYEAYYMRQLLWSMAYLACIPLTIALLYDFIVYNRRKLSSPLQSKI